MRRFFLRESRKENTIRRRSACWASRRGAAGFKMCRLYLLVPVTPYWFHAQRSTDQTLSFPPSRHSLAPLPSLSFSLFLSLSLAFSFSTFLPLFPSLFLSLAADSLSPLRHPLVSSCSTTLCAPTHPLPSCPLTRLRAIYRLLAAVSHASKPNISFTL